MTPDIERLERIGRGDAINITYKKLPIASLDDFRADLLNAVALICTLQARIDALEDGLRPFANVARQIRNAVKDESWLEKVLFYMGDDNDPTKWSLTGRAFDRARAILEGTTK